MNRSPLARAAAAAACVLTATLALLWSPARADAHAELLSTEPASGEHLATAPDQVVLHFSEAVNLGDDLVKVLDSSGDEVDAGDPVHVDGERSSVALPLPPLDDGPYVVSWRVISSDGHPVGGAFTFRVGDASAAAPGDDQALIDDVLGGGSQGDTVLGVVYGIARFAAFAGIVVLVGGLAFVAWLWPAGRDDRRARRIGAVAWWTALVATAGLHPAVRRLRRRRVPRRRPRPVADRRRARPAERAGVAGPGPPARRARRRGPGEAGRTPGSSPAWGWPCS